jgi:hypothetical protein
MSEEFLIDQLDEAVDAILAGGEVITFTTDERILSEIGSLGVELRCMPRESFKSQLIEALKRSARRDD